MTNLTRTFPPEAHGTLEQRLRRTADAARRPLPPALHARIADSITASAIDVPRHRAQPWLATLAGLCLVFLAAGSALFLQRQALPDGPALTNATAPAVIDHAPRPSRLQELVRRSTRDWSSTVSLENEMELLERDTRTAAQFVLARLPIPRSARDKLTAPDGHPHRVRD